MQTMTIQTALPPRQALAAARYWALNKTPYFSQAILSLVPREVPDGTLSPNGTFAVTPDLIMLYEPSALRRWTTPEAGAVLIHEVMHVLRDHAGRREMHDADATLWNLAGDCEINDDLAAMKLPLPDGGGVQPQSFKLPIGKTAEEYYVALKKQDEAEKQKAKSGQGGSNGNQQDQQAGGGSSDQQGQQAGGSQAPSEKHAGHRCGGCAGNAHKAEPKDDAKGRTTSDLEVMKQATAIAVRDHAQRHGIGSVPAGMARWAEQRTTPPKVPWQQKLATLGRARVAFRPGAADYSFNRVSRRQGGLGFGVGKPVVPAMVARTPEVAIAVDTSGSMGTSEVERAVIEATTIMRTVGAAVHLLACDCRVHTTRKVSNPKQLLDGLRGGGGTDFRPVFDELSKVRPRPDVLIFITDGGGWAPELPPSGIKVIWLLVGSHKMKPLRPTGGTYESITWGDMIEVDE